MPAQRALAFSINPLQRIDQSRMTHSLRDNTPMKQACTFTLLLFFCLSSFVGAAERAICIDQETVHLLPTERLLLSNCHATTADASGILAPESTRASDDAHHAPCLDIALNSCDSSLPSSQSHKFSTHKVAGLLFTAPPPLFYQTAARTSLKVPPLPSSFAPQLVSLRTVVLLI